MPQSLMQSPEQRQGSQSCSQVPVLCVHSGLLLVAIWWLFGCQWEH